MQQIGRNCAVSKIGGEKEEKKKKLEQQSRKKEGGEGWPSHSDIYTVYRVAPNVRLGYTFHGLTFGVFGKALSRFLGGGKQATQDLHGEGGTKKDRNLLSPSLPYTPFSSPPLHTNASLMARFRGGAERGEEGGTQINSVDAES